MVHNIHPAICRTAADWVRFHDALLVPTYPADGRALAVLGFVVTVYRAKPSQ
jgi:hypothetical protein